MTANVKIDIKDGNTIKYKLSSEVEIPIQLEKYINEDMTMIVSEWVCMAVIDKMKKQEIKQKKRANK